MSSMNPHPSGDDRYLWDRTGPPDADVARLETLLAPLAHRGEAPPAPRAAIPSPRRRVAWLPFSLAAAASLVAFAWFAREADEPRGGCALPEPGYPTSAPRVADSDGSRLDAGAWIRTEGESKEVVLDAVGRVTVHPESRLQIAHVSAEVTRLYLERGQIEARIGADVRPRFFQVDTAAARCVDLGCRYVLSAEPDGSSKVSVLTGRVSFETQDAAAPGHVREVFVPARAVCVATKGRGPGTPRFEDAPLPLAKEVDAFDAAEAPQTRREHAKAAAAAALSNEDLLPVWHWLTDKDAEVARTALTRLRERAGDPDDWTPPADRPGIADREAFRGRLGFAR